MPDTPRRIRGDLRFLRLYAFTVHRVMRYRPHQLALAASEAPADVADRIETGLAGEAKRYRAMGWCILGLLAFIPGLAAFLWSGMYWLPWSIYWWPFQRGNYGLPYLSLFEWLAYAGLAIYFAVTGVLLWRSHDETGRLGTEYRRLAETPDDARPAFAAAIADGQHPRAEFVLRARSAKEFSAYAPLLNAGERS